jgi:hypothetical protein
MASTTTPGRNPVPGLAQAPGAAPATGLTRAPGAAPAPALTRVPDAPVPGAPGKAETPAVPAHMLPQRSPAQLLAMARAGLTEAAHTTPDGLRYAAAHLAALRAAAALLAARARPAASGRRARATSVWSLLSLVAPEFSDWAGYFALGAGKRAAAEAGIPRVVSAREADDLLRAAEQFVTVAESSLGMSYQPPLAA